MSMLLLLSLPRSQAHWPDDGGTRADTRDLAPLPCAGPGATSGQCSVFRSPRLVKRRRGLCRQVGREIRGTVQSHKIPVPE